MVTFYQCINFQTYDHVSLFCYCIISLCSLCIDGIKDTSPFVVANLANGLVTQFHYCFERIVFI